MAPTALPRHQRLLLAQPNRSCCCSQGLRTEPAALLACSQRALPPSVRTSLARTGTSRMSLWTPCMVVGPPSPATRIIQLRGCGGRCHPHSRHLSGTYITSMGSRSPVRDRTVCTRPELSAYALPICWRSEPPRHAALRVPGARDSLLCSPQVPLPYLTWRLVSERNGPEPSALTSEKLRLTPFRSIAVQTLHWKVDLTPLEAPFCDLTSAGSNPFQGQRRTAAVTGALRDSEGTNCSILPFARYPSPLTPASQPSSSATCARTLPLWCPKEAEPGTAGVSCSVMSRQSSYFSRATLTHARTWQGPRQLPKRGR